MLKKTIADYPHLVNEWHPTKNGSSVPSNFSYGSGKKVWWKCKRGHEWEISSSARTGKNATSCPYCSGRKVNSENCLAKLLPDIAAEWHPSKNLENNATMFTKGSGKVIWWLCGVCNHEWLAAINARAKGTNCPNCYSDSILKVSEFLIKAKKKHNNKYDYSKVNYINSKTKVIITCKIHGDFKQLPYTHLAGTGCPECYGTKKLTTSQFISKAKLVHGNLYDYSKVNYINSKTNVIITCKIHGDFKQLPGNHYTASGCSKCIGKNTDTVHFISKAKLVHGNLYDYSKVNYIDSKTKVIITCKIHGDFEQVPNNYLHGNGCPVCSKGWQFDKIKKFIEENILPDIQNYSQMQLLAIFESNGLLTRSNIGRYVFKKLLKNPYSTVDELFDNSDTDLEECEYSLDYEELNVENIAPPNEQIRQLFESRNNEKILVNLDEENLRHFILEDVQRLWHSVFNGGSPDIINGVKLNSYQKKIVELFLPDYKKCTDFNLKLVNHNNKICSPNLMQALTVLKLAQQKRLINISDMGAGKTLAAISYAAYHKCKLIVIICPNNDTKDHWIQAAEDNLQNCVVHDFFQDNLPKNKTNIILLNYEKFQQDYSSDKIKALVNNNIDLIVLDEVPLAKSREYKPSQRHLNILELTTSAIKKNSDVRILGLTGTPIINHLSEGISLLELVTGIKYNDIDTRPTINNCVKVRRQFILNGIRYINKTKKQVNIKVVSINCTKYKNEIMDNSHNHYVLDRLCLKYKMPCILKNLTKGTIIYTHNVDKVVDFLDNQIESQGWNVSNITGETEPISRSRIIKRFLNGSIDVIVASKPMVLGIDGLQKACNKIILAIPAWTNADKDQLVARINRPGQKNEIEIIMPSVYFMLDGERVSWDEQRYNNIIDKKTLCDAVADGIIPREHHKTEKQCFNDYKELIIRLNQNETVIAERNIINIVNVGQTIRKPREIGSFLRKHMRLKCTDSDNIREEDVISYHKQRRNYVASLTDVVAQWCKKNWVIGDFGCGNAVLAKKLKNNKVYSFDHAKINEYVTKCDMKKVPLNDQCLDAAVFLLSISWGSDQDAYLKEARRCLKNNAKLFIVDITKNIDNDSFEALLLKNKFKVCSQYNRGKLTFMKVNKV